MLVTISTSEPSLLLPNSKPNTPEPPERRLLIPPELLPPANMSVTVSRSPSSDLDNMSMIAPAPSELLLLSIRPPRTEGNIPPKALFVALSDSPKNLAAGPKSFDPTELVSSSIKLTDILIKF